MKIIVGLGNPGEKYENTRHNLGFLVLDKLLKDITSVEDSNWRDVTKFKSETCEVLWKPKIGGEEKIVLVKPKTYMNNSGMAVQLITSFYKLDPEDLWVVYDELDLPLGALKIRFGGAAAGHRGVENIIQTLGTDKFWRFRLGIAQIRHIDRTDEGKGHIVGKVKFQGVDDYVLGSFEGKDRTEAKKMVKHAADAVQVALEKGLETAQNRYNTK